MSTRHLSFAVTIAMCLFFGGITQVVAQAHSIESLLAELDQLSTQEIVWEDGPLLIIRPNTPATAAPGWAGLGATDRTIIEAGTAFLNLLAKMGGDDNRALILQRTANGLFIAQDGQPGALAPTLRAALIARLTTFMKSQPAFSAAQFQNSTALSDFAAALSAGPKTLPASGQIDLVLETEDFATRPMVGLPDGVHLIAVIAVAGGWQITVNVGDAAKAGASEIRLFSQSNALDPVATYDIVISDSEQGRSDTSTPLPSTTRLDIDSAGGQDIAGSFSSANDASIFSFSLTQTTSVEFETSGQSDVSLTLSNAQQELAFDDDSGHRYNAKLAQTLGPGDYTVMVKHCCEGNGLYRLTGRTLP